MTLDDHDIRKHAIYGIAAMIPGVQTAIDVLTDLLENMRTQLAAYRGAESLPKPKTKYLTQKTKRAELVAQGLTVNGKPRKAHPRDPNHPGHAAWLKKINAAKKVSTKSKHYSKAQKGYWDAMSPEERKAEMARRIKLRQKNAKIATKVAA